MPGENVVKRGFESFLESSEAGKRGRPFAPRLHHCSSMSSVCRVMGGIVDVSTDTMIPATGLGMSGMLECRV